MRITFEGVRKFMYVSLTRDICLQEIGSDTVEAVTQSMQASTLQAADPAPMRSTNPPPRHPPRGEDPSAAAQYQYQREAEATARLDQYQQTGEDPDHLTMSRRRFEDQARTELAPPRSSDRPNTNDPFNVSRLHQQQATSSNTSQYNPHGQRLQPVPQTPYRPPPQAQGFPPVPQSSYQPPPQEQRFPPVPQSSYLPPPQGHDYPSGYNAMLPQPTPQGPGPLPSKPPVQAMGPPSSFETTMSQREELSRQSKDPRGSEKRSNDPDPSQSPKGSKGKKRRGARDGKK